jgi:hypothetical protein
MVILIEWTSLFERAKVDFFPPAGETKKNTLSLSQSILTLTTERRMKEHLLPSLAIASGSFPTAKLVFTLKTKTGKK